MPRPNRVSAVVLSFAAVAATGCGPHVGLQLNMRQESLTVPRLLAPAVTLVPPAPVVVTPPLPSIPVIPPAPPIVPPATPAPSCPKADEFAVPAEPASITLDQPPASATYLESSTGSYSGSTATPSSGKLTAPVVSVVTKLPQTTSAVGQLSDNWVVVRSEPTGKMSAIEQYQLVHPSSSVQAVSPGLYLVWMKWKDPVRGDLSFVPAGGGVEILPSPINTSSTSTYASSATDPDSLTTMNVVGNVTGRKRVDVCGTLVDTFTVALSGTLTGPSFLRQFTWRQQVATQYGGLLVENQLSLTTPGGGLSWDRTLHDTNAPEVSK